MASSKQTRKPAKGTQKSGNQTRKLTPVFVETADGEDIKDLLYVRNEDGELKSLTELQLELQSLPDPIEVPVLTSNIIETSSPGLGTTVASVSTSPYNLCYIIIAGRKITFPC